MKVTKKKGILMILDKSMQTKVGKVNQKVKDFKAEICANWQGKVCIYYKKPKSRARVLESLQLKEHAR